jgi:hypothetical protein
MEHMFRSARSLSKVRPPISIAWDNAVARTCAVVDVYGWAGPCQALVTTFADLHLDVNDEKTLQFLMVRLDNPCSMSGRQH